MDWGGWEGDYNYLQNHWLLFDCVTNLLSFWSVITVLRQHVLLRPKKLKRIRYRSKTYLFQLLCLNITKIDRFLYSRILQSFSVLKCLLSWHFLKERITHCHSHALPHLREGEERKTETLLERPPYKCDRSPIFSSYLLLLLFIWKTESTLLSIGSLSRCPHKAGLSQA